MEEDASERRRIGATGTVRETPGGRMENQRGEDGRDDHGGRGGAWNPRKPGVGQTRERTWSRLKMARDRRGVRTDMEPTEDGV